MPHLKLNGWSIPWVNVIEIATIIFCAGGLWWRVGEVEKKLEQTESKAVADVEHARLWDAIAREVSASEKK